MHRRRDVGVVIVSYASSATLPKTLRALPHQDLADVVVVDNDSPDGSAEIARAEGARVVEQANLGFGAGNNRGDAELDCDLVLFLNPDAVLEHEALDELVAYLDTHPQCALVGPRVLHDGAPTYSAGHGTSLASEIRPLLPSPVSRWGPQRRLAPTYASSGPVGYVEGCCFLVRREALAQVGGFDEAYFLYFEELDLAHRLRLRGWTVDLCATTTVEHAMGVSTSTLAHGGSPHLARSEVLYLRRWHGRHAARTWVLAARASWALRARLGRLDPDAARSLRAAAADGLTAPPPR